MEKEKTELELFKNRIKGYFTSCRWQNIWELVDKPAKNIQKLFDDVSWLKFDIHWLVIFHWVLKKKQKELNELIEEIEEYLER